MIAWVRVKIENEGHFLNISVHNPGIPTEEIRKIMFIAGHSNKGREHTGLGLYISNLLAKKLGGMIKYDFAPDTGTIFSVVLPQ